MHKEGGTGGHWCARIIFFSLLAILVGLIGIILIEHRGAADGEMGSSTNRLQEHFLTRKFLFHSVDTPVAESRWATVFDGWVDDVQLSHGAAEPEVKIEEPHEEPEESEEEADHEDNENSQEDDVAENESNEEEAEEGREDEQGIDSYNEQGESEEEGGEAETQSEERGET